MPCPILEKGCRVETPQGDGTVFEFAEFPAGQNEGLVLVLLDDSTQPTAFYADQLTRIPPKGAP